MASYRKINYSLRPGKSIERKMICDAMSKLSIFQRIEDYHYIGFGSTFFSDFSLFHRALGLKNMFSMEKDKHASKRFSFNKPFECIEPVYQHSNEALPNMNWEVKNILWLDYDDKLTAEMFTDINTFFANAQSGSMFMISVNSEPLNITAETEEGEGNEGESYKSEENGNTEENTRIKELEDRIGDFRVPAGLKEVDLSRKNISKTYLRVINNEIEEILSKRNGGIESTSKKMLYKQLLNFKYSDGADMFTCGGILLEQQDEDKFLKANFSDLSFVQNGEEHFKIEIPSLTIKEIKFLESLLPKNINLESGKISGVNTEFDPQLPQGDIKKYAKIYRYFPHFTEAIF